MTNPHGSWSGLQSQQHPVNGCFSRQEELREPIRGANVVILSPTVHDLARVIALVRGSPFDSVRPGQTHCPCLGGQGVAGSNPVVPTNTKPADAG